VPAARTEAARQVHYAELSHRSLLRGSRGTRGQFSGRRTRAGAGTRCATAGSRVRSGSARCGGARRLRERCIRGQSRRAGSDRRGVLPQCWVRSSGCNGQWRNWYHRPSALDAAREAGAQSSAAQRRGSMTVASRLAFVLAVSATATTLSLSVLAGWQRGGSMPERIVWVTIGVVLVVSAHVLPALIRDMALPVRATGSLLWVACLATTCYGYAVFFVLAQEHAGDRRACSSAIIDSQKICQFHIESGSFATPCSHPSPTPPGFSPFCKTDSLTDTVAGTGRPRHCPLWPSGGTSPSSGIHPGPDHGKSELCGSNWRGRVETVFLPAEANSPAKINRVWQPRLANLLLYCRYRIDPRR